MKKIQIKGKLNLNKSTIANLDTDQMNAVKGGVDAKTWVISRCMFSDNRSCCDHICSC